MAKILSFQDYLEPKKYTEVTFYNDKREIINKYHFRKEKDAYDFLYQNDYELEEETPNTVFVCAYPVEMIDYYAVLKNINNTVSV